MSILHEPAWTKLQLDTLRNLEEQIRRLRGLVSSLSDAGAEPDETVWGSITGTLSDQTDLNSILTALSAAITARQPIDGELSALAALVSAAFSVPYFTGSETAALATASTDNQVLTRLAGAMIFSQLTSGMAPDGLWPNAKLADMADRTLKGRALGAGTGVPTDLTPTEVSLMLAAPQYIIQEDEEVFYDVSDFVRGHNIIGVRYDAGPAIVYLPNTLPIEYLITVKDEAGNGEVSISIY